MSADTVTGVPVAERVAAGFTAVYGGAPDGVWSAPGRVNLIGEHTDYNDGFVLPFALPQRTLVAATRLDDPQWTVWSEGTGETVTFGPAELSPGRVEGWAAYVAGVMWALRDAGHDIAGARLAVASDVPLGAGLSSSAALECAVLAALCELSGVDIPVAERPSLAQRAENAYVGVPCGIMDQSASVRCLDGHALFLDCRSLAVEHVPFDVTAAGLAVLVIDTNAPHRHVSGEYAARRRSCEVAAQTLGVAALRDVTHLGDALRRLADPVAQRRVRHVVTENQRVLDTVARLRANDLRGTGPLLTASHTSLRDDYAVTVPELDTAVAAALDAGAHGARMTGGGFGGCVLALVDDHRTEAVAAAVSEASARAGFAIPTTFAAAPGPGAHRLP